MGNATEGEGWFVDVKFRFVRTANMEPPVGKQVLVMDATGDFAVARIVTWNEGTEHEIREWGSDEKDRPLDGSFWAELPEFRKGG